MTDIPEDDGNIGDPDSYRIKTGLNWSFVDAVSMDYLNGAQIDYVDELTGGGFKISNPNAKTNCGCGKSFEA